MYYNDRIKIGSGDRFPNHPLHHIIRIRPAAVILIRPQEVLPEDPFTIPPREVCESGPHSLSFPFSHDPAPRGM